MLEWEKVREKMLHQGEATNCAALAGDGGQAHRDAQDWRVNGSGYLPLSLWMPLVRKLLLAAPV